MIGIVVGVNLIAPVNDVVTTITTPTYASSIVSLTGVLPIIFVTVIILGAVAWAEIASAPFRSNLNRITSQIRGNLNLKRQGNHELNRGNEPLKCVETRGLASLKRDDGIVHTLRKQGVIWDGLQGLICQVQ